MITKPIKLLEERLKEIKAVKKQAEKNKLPEERLKKLTAIHNKYYVSIEVLKRSTDVKFINRGILYQHSDEIYEAQETEIEKLKILIRKLRKKNHELKTNNFL